MTPEEIARAKARRAARQKAKRRKQIRRRITLFFAGTILLTLIIFISYQCLMLHNSAKIEAGTEVYATDFLRFKKKTAEFTDEKEFDISVPGTYKVHIKAGKFRHKVKLIVVDTTAPTVTLKEINVGCDEQVDPENFVASCEDNTKVTYTYETEPNFTQVGKVNVTILATDLGGNVSKQSVVADVTPVMSELEIEAGSSLPAATKFLCKRYQTSKATYTENVDTSVLSHVGNTTVKIKVDGVEYTSILSTKDTTAPKLTLKKSATSYTLINVNPKILVESCDDATDIKYTFEKDPKNTKVGKQKVTVIATDEGGNTDKATTYLELVEDTEKPKIQGAREMIAYVDGSIAYRNFIQYSDNAGAENAKLTIDSSGVNLKKAGTYTIKCTVTDAAGNSTSAEFSVKVIEAAYSEEQLNVKVDAILQNILKTGMTQKEKVKAIYWYVRRNVSFVNKGAHGDWIEAAMLGIEKRSGDCYTFACLTKALLIRANITNMDIQKIPANNVHHYWNLVDIGDGHGWYHLDTCPRAGVNPTILLWTDSQLMEYSNSHKKSHNYDKTLYPNIA